MIANLWAYLDLLQTYIAWLSVWFTIYAWKPVWEISWVNWYFTLVSNSEKIGDDSTWTLLKEATLDFYIISWDKATPDVVLFEKLDALSNALITEASERITLPSSNFIIYSIQEWQQSWVLHDVKENPYIAAQYKIIYQYRYTTDPRI